MYKDRVELYSALEKMRETKILVYVTGDRQGLETQIHPEALDMFVHHLDGIGNVPKISLYLYTRGGQTLAAWSIANLIRQYCDQFEIIIPAKAHSAGTLICLGANNIVMTRQATLGPIDPSVNTPLNPQVPGAPPNARYPVSVEAINGFIELAKGMGISESNDLSVVLTNLSNHVHPLVLGEVFRTRSQIKMLGSRLLSKHMDDETKIERILAFLCSESGSHDYTIYHQEARDDLGLNIESPDKNQYDIIKLIYNDIVEELSLTTPYEPILILGNEATINYSFPRSLIECAECGSFRFISEGNLAKRQIPKDGVMQQAIQDTRTFEGWKYEPPIS